MKGVEQALKGYRIAVIIEDIGQSYQSAILNGIVSSSSKFEMNIAAFVSFSGEMNNPRHDIGEFNIYNLPDFRLFDGAILLTNTLTYQPLADKILSRIKDAGIPAVSIDNDIPCFYHIGIDNKTAMRKIVEHMINDHGYKSFNYISGPANNPESADRLSAFLEVLEEHDLSISEDRIYYGDFKAPSGKAAAEYFLEKTDGMPEAIICANDVMAASAINRLSAEGYSVPDDIAVTGFDNTYNNYNFQVELTSVDRPLELSGRLACKMLYNHFNGIFTERNVILDMSNRFTESCGCRHNALSDISKIKEINYRNYNKLESIQNYSSMLNRLSTQLLACNNFDEYIATLKKITLEIDIDECYFCLCENWDSDTAVGDSVSRDGDPPAVPTEYTERMLVPLAYKNGEFFECDPILSREIFPHPANNDETGKFYYITPLHFAERCLGYLIIYSSRIQFHNAMFETFSINISNSLENIRKLMCLEYAVDRLDRLYTRDTFSGIYNRNGFVQATEKLYNECIAGQLDIMLMFLDLDGLKVINDTYGHSTGDIAICNIADILKDSCQKNEVFCRFGGDEFIVFGADYSENAAKQLTKRINAKIKEINDLGQNPFELSASIGFVIAAPKQGEDIFYFVTEADKKMYNEKRKKKLSRYLKG